MFVQIPVTFRIIQNMLQVLFISNQQLRAFSITTEVSLITFIYTSCKNEWPMDHIAHLRYQFKQINTFTQSYAVFFISTLGLGPTPQNWKNQRQNKKFGKFLISFNHTFRLERSVLRYLNNVSQQINMTSVNWRNKIHKIII